METEFIVLITLVQLMGMHMINLYFAVMDNNYKSILNIRKSVHYLYDN